VAVEVGDAPLRVSLDGDPQVLPDGEQVEREVAVRLVDVPAEVHEPFYGVIANPLLWFLQHRLHDLKTSPSLGRADRAAFEDGYVVANALAADAVVEQVDRAGGRALVLLHDYHFYLVGQLVRERCPKAVISHFVHIPWPGPEAWQVLPPDMRERLLGGLLGCDVVAFHTRGYARNFMETVSRVLGAEADFEGGTVRYEGREVWVRAYPISIDPDEFEEFAGSEAVLEQERFVKDLPGKLLLRVDRTDLSKNVVRGFEAYGRMLERHPEMAGGVTFLAQLQPSRGDIPEYAAYMEAVGRTAEEINERQGTDSWRPIELFMQDNFPRSVAAYKNYDVLLVNAVRDGMNLVAKEAAVVNERGGVLVLSEYAGAHEELGEHALTVNPYDLDEQADAIYKALTMPEDERHRRAEALRETVLGNTIDDWVEAQVKDIEAYRGRRG